MKHIWIVLFCLVSFPVSADDWDLYTLMGGFSMKQLETSAFNERAEAAGLSEIQHGETPFFQLTASLTLREPLYLSFGADIHSSSHESGDFLLDEEHTGFDLNLHYAVFHEGRHSIAPFAGIGAVQYKAEWRHREGEQSFDNALNTFGRSREMETGNNWYVNAGAEYTFKIFRYYMGVRGGYRIPISTTAWGLKHGSVTNAPSANPSGYFITFALGI